MRPGHLEREELVQVAFLLLVAGNATVASMIALVQTRSWGKGPYAKERLEKLC